MRRRRSGATSTVKEEEEEEEAKVSCRGWRRRAGGAVKEAHYSK